MADGKIRREDLFDESALQAINEVAEGMKKLADSFKAALKDAQQLNKEITKSQSMKELNKQTVEATKLQNKLTLENKKFEQSLRDVELKAQRQALATEKIAVATKKFDEAQKKATTNTNTWGKAMGSFQAKFNTLGNIIGGLAVKALASFRRGLTTAFNIIKDFESAQARLTAITGKTAKEIENLTKQARQLGSQTKFTATQVTDLQIELGKLGFSVNEITASTPGILKFAAATGAELADAAKTAGVAIRAFGLSTAETDRVVSALAVATTKSALSFADYDTVLSTVGPVARAYGFTLEDTIALTGKLRDAGFDASKASTALRNIFLSLADSNGVLAKTLGRTPKTMDELVDGLVEMNTKGYDLNETLEMTDKRSVAAFNQFLRGAESSRELRDGITGVTGELDTMVEKMEASTEGALKKLSSAWEGFLLNLNEGVGILRAVGGMIDFLTDAINELSNTDLMFRRSSKLTADQLERTYDNALNFSRAYKGIHFKDVIKEFDELSYELLVFGATQEKEFIKSVEGAGFASERSAVLWQEYLRRRKEQFDIEAQAHKEGQDRMADDAEQARQGELRKAKALHDQKIAEGVKATEKLMEDAWKILDAEDTVWRNRGEQDTEGFEWKIEESNDATEKLVADIWKIAENELQAYEEVKALKDQELKDIEDREKIKEDLVRQGFDTLAMFTQNQLDLTKQAMDREIAMSDGSAEARTAIEEKYHAKLIKLQKRQANIEKLAASFNIIMYTAQGIANALAKTVTAPLAPFIAAMGAAQLAAVLAQPVPEFWKGTQNAPEGPAWTGERGREMLIDQHGGMQLTPDRPTLTYLKRGTRVIPAHKTKEMIENVQVSRAPGSKSGEITNIVNNNQGGKAKHQPIININSAGITVMTQSATTLTKRIDKYFR